MSSLYEITGDMLALNNLMETLVDENGEPREPTEDEMNQMREWFTGSLEEFEKKLTTTVNLLRI